MNAADIIIILVVLSVVGFIIGRQVWKRSKGKSVGGCSGCAGCPSVSACEKAPEVK